MTCPPFCDTCGGNLGHASNGDDTCAKCKTVALRQCRKERIRKDEFDPSNPNHFRLQSRGGVWRYYRKFGTNETLDDQEIERKHGDDRKHPIATWRGEFNAGNTALDYIDWRADRKYYQGNNHA